MEVASAEESAHFLPYENSVAKKKLGEDDGFQKLLTREDLLHLDKNEPKWRRLRLILFILFWVVWFGLLIASIIVIVVSPKCPPVRDLTFWQSKVGYWVDPFAFRDSDADGIGDFKGLIEKLHYIKQTVGAGFLILDGFVQGQFSGSGGRLGTTLEFERPDDALGTQKDFRSMIKAYHKEGLEVVVGIDFNSVHSSHPWAQNYTRKYTQTLITRSGVETNAGTSYTAFGHDTVDLDFRKPSLIEKIKAIIEYWLNDGADGILLSNAAFYSENIQSSDASSQSWKNTALNRQVFVADSAEVVKALLSTVNQISTQTSRPRVLVVDAGDTGFGVSEKDESVMFLGTDEEPISHLVISRLFTYRQGSKFDDTKDIDLLELYDKIYGQINKAHMALATATPSDRYHKDTVSLASIFLLPGTPLIYYGSELGQDVAYRTVFTNPDVYPKNKVPLVNNADGDSSLACHLPMPWDRTGKGFTSKVLASKWEAYDETVERVMAAARGTTPFKMVQSLIQLRKETSLLWGNYKKIEHGLQDANINLHVFMRKAEGYPAYVVVLIRNAVDFKEVIRFPDTCKQLTPKLLYPSSPNLKVDETLEGNLVFVNVPTGDAVYVFKCHDL